MRTFLSKTALGAVIIATLFACTKDLKERQVTTQDGILSAVSPKTANQNQPQNPEEKKPLLVATQSPVLASVGKPVTITFTASDAISKMPIGCGKLTIYQWDGTQWIVVKEANDPSASYTFTPTTTTDCAYKFRAGFAPGGNVQCKGSYSGVNYLDETDFCVDVQDCVETFTITSEVEAKPVENGQYEFTISYTLISPKDVNGVKFQGGATAGGKVGSTITYFGNTTIVNDNNNNTVLKWDGNLKACTPQIVSFKYRRNFSCPATAEKVTGGWSAIVGDVELGSILPLTYSCN